MPTNWPRSTLSMRDTCPGEHMADRGRARANIQVTDSAPDTRHPSPAPSRICLHMRRTKSSPAEPLRVHLISLGCPKNLVDTEVIAGHLATAGFALASEPDLADILLINTCGFIADARREADSEIRTALRWKRQRRGRRVVIGGCLPQHDPAHISERYPDVDLILGVDDIPRVAERLLRAIDDAQPREEPAPISAPTFLYDHTAPRLRLTPHSYSYVKIADGCDHRCAFCSIPNIRGRQRSRTVDSVLTECRQLLDLGARELDLIAQDSTRYGHDLHDGSDLLTLVRACDRLDGQYWLRLLYTHPRHITEDVIRGLAETQHLAPYIDIPLQHISDRVLHGMGRGRGGAATRRLMEHLRRLWPGVAVRTTFLVGYTGETAADFEELFDFVRDYRFERLGVFTYSHEDGTRAAAIRTGRVPGEVAGERRARLMELQQAISLRRNQAAVGTTLRVIVDAAAGPRSFLGRSGADAPEIDNLVRFTGPRDCLERGFVDVRITRADPYDLHGRAAG